MVRQKYRLLAILALGFLALAFGAEGGLPSAFLSYGAAPRSLGMGKAFTGVADDAQAIYFNPGGLFQLNAHEVLLAHSQLYGARMEYLSYALPTKEFGTFGLGILNYGAEGIDSRTPENWRYEPTAFAENAYIVTYAYNPWHFLGLGGTVKLITKNLATFSDVGLGADLGVLVKVPKYFSFGVMLQNAVEPVLTLANLADRYPRTVRMGAAVRFLQNRVILTADVVSPILRTLDSLGNPTKGWKLDMTPHGGLEFAIIPGILIHRVGIDPNEISFGLGIHKSWGKMATGVDYAFLLHHQSDYLLNPTHKLGVFIDFSGFRVWIDAQPRLFTPVPGDSQNVLWMNVQTVARAPVKRWQVLIKNGFGEVIRSYSGWDAPPPRLWWDGLDDAGRLAADGKYYYEIVVVDQRNSSLSFSGFLTTIKTKGPKGKIEIRPGD